MWAKTSLPHCLPGDECHSFIPLSLSLKFHTAVLQSSICFEYVAKHVSLCQHKFVFYRRGGEGIGKLS